MNQQVIIDKTALTYLKGDYVAAAVICKVTFFEANKAKFKSLFHDGFLVRNRKVWAEDLVMSVGQFDCAIKRLVKAGLLETKKITGTKLGSVVTGLKFIPVKQNTTVEDSAPIEEMLVEAPKSPVVTSTSKPTVVHHYDPKPRMPVATKPPMAERKVAAPIVDSRRPTKRLDELFPERKELVKPNDDPYSKEWKAWKGQVNWFAQTAWVRAKISEVSKSFNVVTNW